MANDIVATAKAQSEVDQMDLDPSQSKGIKRKTSSSVASDTPPKKFPDISSSSSGAQQTGDDGWQTVERRVKRYSTAPSSAQSSSSRAVNRSNFSNSSARSPSNKAVNRSNFSNSSARSPLTRPVNRSNFSFSSSHWDRDQLRVYASSHDMSPINSSGWSIVEDFVMDTIMDSFDGDAHDGDLTRLPDIFFQRGLGCGVLKCSPSSILFFKSLINEKFEGRFRAWSVSDNPLHLVRLYIPQKFNRYSPDRWIKGIFACNQLTDHSFTLRRTDPEGAGRAVFFQVEDSTRTVFASHGWCLVAPIGTALLSPARFLPPPRQSVSSQPHSQIMPSGSSSSEPLPLVPIISGDFPPLSSTVQQSKSSGTSSSNSLPPPPLPIISGDITPLSTTTSGVCPLEPPEPSKSISQSPLPPPSSQKLSQPKRLGVESSISYHAPIVNSPTYCIDHDVSDPNRS